MSKKPKIKFLLAQAGRALVFEIYEMDEQFRSDEDKERLFIASNGVEVRSDATPSLDEEDQVYLRGKGKQFDGRCTTLIFDTPEEAKIYQAKVLKALKDWADNWEGWDEKTAELSGDPNVYTFY